MGGGDINVIIIIMLLRENILTYSLAEQNSFFYMTSEEDSSGSSVGVIRVKEVNHIQYNYSHDINLINLVTRL